MKISSTIAKATKWDYIEDKLNTISDRCDYNTIRNFIDSVEECVNETFDEFDIEVVE